MEQTRWYKRRWVALGFLSFSLLVIALDNTVLNLAMPTISTKLGSTLSGMQWIVDAYVLVFAALLLTMGSIGDRIGRKRTLQAGLIVFGCFSLGAALSRSTGMLIAMRAIMGIGGAMIMPSTLSILTATFRDPKERGQAIALWAAVFALGLGIGPLVGGWLLAHFSWSSVFYINLPIVVVALIGGYIFLHDSRDEHPSKIDLPGSVLSIAGLFALVYGIIEAGQSSWTAHNVLYAFGAAAVLLGAFAYWEWRSPNAVLPIAFFKNMSFTGANIALTLVAFALMGSMFFMGQYLQTVQGYTPLKTGVLMLPFAFTSFAAAAMSARVAQRIGTKFTVALGILISAAGLFYLSRVVEVNTSYPTILLGMVIMSLGIGSTMSPATNSIMGSIPVRKAGVGSAMNDTTRQVGAALGVAVLGALMNSVYISKINAMKDTFSSTPQVFELIRSSIQRAHFVAQNMIPDPQLSQMIVNKADEAFVSGMVRGTLIASIVMAVASVVTLIILPSRVRPAKEEDHAPGIPDSSKVE
ncbi:MAG: MFS transporter [Chloroflexi bacterium]|nr:MFS transporter [Chloroflexota bacterium]